MTKQTLVLLGSKIFVGVSALSIGYVSLLSLADPKSTMSLVSVTLDNTDAISSIRGVYGGVGLTLLASLVYLYFRHLKMAVGFLVLFWGSYVLSRAITIFQDGPLGPFGTQWILIEAMFFVIGLLLSLSQIRLKHGA